MAIIVRIAGAGATHIALSNNMCKSLQTMYHARNVVNSSNAFLVDCAAEQRAPRRDPSADGSLRIGYLSNLSTEKGLLDVFDVFQLLEDDFCRAVRLDIAGAAADSESLATVGKFCADHAGVRYWGPVGPQERSSFLQQIDVFIFPSRYRNEAEPLVVLEAMRAGVPVISTAIGCVPEISRPAHWCLPLDSAFPRRAANLIRATTSEDLSSAGDDALERFEDLRAQSERALTMILAAAAGDSPT